MKKTSSSFDWDAWEASQQPSMYALLSTYDETTCLHFMATNLTDVLKKFYEVYVENHDYNTDYFIVVQNKDGYMSKLSDFLKSGADFDIDTQR
jgi:hypothetical protein